MKRRILVGLIIAAAMVWFTASARASIVPTLTLDQSAGTGAGSTTNLGIDLKFAPSANDSPKDLTLRLPPGLLANASIDKGACLKTHAPTAACQVGSGTVTASAGGLVPASGRVGFDLVAPPRPGDLAGLALQLTLLGQTSQLGSPGEITVRPPSDPDGFGLDIAFANIPDTYSVLGVAVPISVDELKSTLTGVRLPASCPATPASVAVTADSYSAPATEHTVKAPLHVTGCSALPFKPAFHVSAAKDTGDDGVRITAEVTQPARPVQSTSRTVKLKLPTKLFAPNALPLVGDHVFCADPSSGACKPVGTATSTSPLYPLPLTGKDYLTGSVVAPQITIVFPPPFALSLIGTVNPFTNVTMFDNVPDIPLTDLQVTLSGGHDAAFVMPSCVPPSGTAKATLTSYGGSRTVVSSFFTVGGCASRGGGTGRSSRRSGKPRIESASISGIARGRPAIRFRLAAGKHAAKLRAFAIGLPRGLRFVAHRVHGRVEVRGVSVKGARVKSLVLRRGRLVVTLVRPGGRAIVTIAPRALKESASLRRDARRHHLRRLTLKVVVTDAAGHRTTLRRRLRLK